MAIYLLARLDPDPQKGHHFVTKNVRALSTHAPWGDGATPPPQSGHSRCMLLEGTELPHQNEWPQHSQVFNPHFDDCYMIKTWADTTKIGPTKLPKLAQLSYKMASEMGLEALQISTCYKVAELGFFPLQNDHRNGDYMGLKASHFTREISTGIYAVLYCLLSNKIVGWFVCSLNVRSAKCPFRLSCE